MSSPNSTTNSVLANQQDRYSHYNIDVFNQLDNGESESVGEILQSLLCKGFLVGGDQEQLETGFLVGGDQEQLETGGYYVESDREEKEDEQVEPYLPTSIVNFIGFCNDKEKFDVFKYIIKGYLEIDLDWNECCGEGDNVDRGKLKVHFLKQLLREVLPGVELETIVRMGKVGQEQSAITEELGAGNDGLRCSILPNHNPNMQNSNYTMGNQQQLSRMAMHNDMNGDTFGNLHLRVMLAQQAFQATAFHPIPVSSVAKGEASGSRSTKSSKRGHEDVEPDGVFVAVSVVPRVKKVGRGEQAPIPVPG
ncbi:hypothetical protein HDU76_000322 [Blyttiomyces sp. JEL0837]|nr:hypothetical protein HDU76_000322 [Blyttiomyces sp. JEL0837]